MDYINFVLYAALAIITYLLLLAWQRDYPAVIDNALSSAARSTDNSFALELGDANIFPPSALSAEIESPSDAPLQVQDVGDDSNSRFITVETDSLQLTIDLQGGDIVSLSLPKFPKQVDQSSGAFELLHDTIDKTYIAQSGLIGLDNNSSRAVYNAARSSYSMSDSENILSIDLITEAQDGVEIIKRFTFERDSYLITIDFLINNQSQAAWEGAPFAQLRRTTHADPGAANGFMKNYLGFVGTSDSDPYIEIEFEDINDQPMANRMKGGWIGFSQHYFLSAMVPSSNSINDFFTRVNNVGQYFSGFTANTLSVSPGSSASYQFEYYAGPKDSDRLRAVSPNLELTIDYGILGFIATPIHWLLTRINSVLGNFGYSIIVLTILMKAAFFKLSETQYRSTANMRKLAPKMQALKERYAEDKLGFQKASMELYKKENVSLLGGCLPALVQMPVFLALYWVLMESVELRHSPFLFWITDLSVQDPYFVLPLLMGATMLLQSRFNPTPADPMQAKMTKFLPLVMTAFFLTFPAGLVLYWFTSSTLSMAHQWWVTRRIDREMTAC